MGKYLIRLLLYLALFFVSFSVVSVLWLKFVPVTVTPLKVVRYFDKTEGGRTPRSRWTSLGEISPQLVRAVIATEDNRFTRHRGFDCEEIRRARQENRQGRRVRGASTISQQTAKNVFCLPTRTWTRKALEAWFTLLIEPLWGKERIMEVYLNVIETHGGVYGAEATAREFYGKPASRLNEYEAAMIATVLPSPSRMNLAAPSGYMTRRAADVRRLMRQLGPVELRPERKKENQNGKKDKK